MRLKKAMIKSKNALTMPYYYRHIGETNHLHRIARQVAYAPPQVPILTPCKSVNLQWRPHINGVLDVLLDDDVWHGSQDTIDWAKQQVMLLMQVIYKVCEKTDDEDSIMILRQNPTNPCQLQQLIDGVWELAFDYGLCLSPKLDMLQANIIQDVLEGVQAVNAQIETALQTDPPQTVFPDTDNSQQDPNNVDKNRLLCAVIWDYLLRARSFIEAMHRASQGSNITQSDVNDSVGRTIASGFSFIVAVFSPLPIKILSWLARLGTGINFGINAGNAINTTTTYYRELWQASLASGDTYNIPLNTDGLQEIACAIYDGLKDKPITQANFESALQGIQVSDNVLQAVRNVYIFTLANSLIFGEFLAVYQEAYIAFNTGAEVPNLGNCECVPIDDCNGWDYWFEYIEVVPPPIIQLYQSFPRENAPVNIPIIPLQRQQGTEFQINYWYPIYIVQSEPCDLGVTLQWTRANTNTHWAYIEIFDGQQWLKVTGDQTQNVGGVANITSTLYWSNPTGQPYQAIRGVVNGSASRIIRFKTGQV